MRQRTSLNWTNCPPCCPMLVIWNFRSGHILGIWTKTNILWSARLNRLLWVQPLEKCLPCTTSHRVWNWKITSQTWTSLYWCGNTLPSWGYWEGMKVNHPFSNFGIPKGTLQKLLSGFFPLRGYPPPPPNPLDGKSFCQKNLSGKGGYPPPPLT